MEDFVVEIVSKNVECCCRVFVEGLFFIWVFIVVVVFIFVVDFVFF